MSDTAIVMPLNGAFKHSVTTHPKQTSYSAWAKAGLVFGTSVGAFALAKVTGALSWAGGLFGSNSNTGVHDGAIVAQKQADVLAVGYEASIVDMRSVLAENNNGVGAVAFKELQVPEVVSAKAMVTKGIGGRRSQSNPEVGEEFNVGLDMTSFSNSGNPWIARLMNGNFVVTFNGNGLADNNSGIYAQMYYANGTACGGDFLVNTITGGYQGYAQIVGLSSGQFVITWMGAGTDYDIYAQMYNLNGSPYGSEFLVNTYISASQQYPAIAELTDGKYVIAWQSNGQEGGGYGVYAQMYNGGNVPYNSEFKVNSYTSSDQLYPIIAGLSDGKFVIAWSSNGQDGDGYGAYAQMYNANGTPYNSEFRVNTYTTVGNQFVWGVSKISNGKFIVAWGSAGQDGSLGGVYARIYNNDGSAVGVEEFQINTYVIGDQGEPRIRELRDGKFIIAWRSNLQDGDNYGIYAQVYYPNATRYGSEFRINTVTIGYQDYISIAGLDNSKFATTWGGSGGVYAKICSINPLLKTNALTINEGQTVTLSTSNLYATTGCGIDNPALSFVVSAVQNGNFTLNNVPSTSFTQQDVTDSKVKFIHNGGEAQPDYMVSVADSNAITDPASPSVSFTNINDAPILSSTGSTLSYSENNGPVVIDNAVIISDVDSVNMNNATITIKTNYVSGEDYLRFTNQSGITGNFDADAGVLTLTGSATVAQYQTALRSIKYENILENPSILPRSISFEVNDGVLNSNEITRQITVTAVNDAPTISSTGSTLGYTENSGPVTIDNTITVADVDNTNINNATVTIKTNYADGEDFLRFTTQNGITGNFNALAGALTLSGSATIAQYQTALQNVQYENTSDNPAIAARTIGFVVNDGTANSNELTRQITVARLNDAPTITQVPKSGTKNVAITFNQADFTSKFSDIDGDSLTKIQIISLPANGTLKLNTTPVNINDEILVANLAQLSFVPANNWNGATSFSWNGFDGTTYSAAAANVNIAIGNTAPTVTAIAKTGAEDGTVTFVASDFTSKFSDVDGDSLTKIQITSLPTNGTLKLNGLAVAINDEITVANLSNLTFEPTQYWHGATSFNWKGHDGVEYSANTAAVDFTISHINHKPTINAVPKSANEDTVITFSSTDFSSKFSDVDSATSGDSLTKIQILSLPNYGTLKLNGIVIIANQEILANELNTLTFEPNANWNGQTSFTWKGYDGYVYSDANTVQLNILSINDAPTIGAIVKTGDQDSMLKFTDLDFINHFSDVDGDTLKQVQIIDLPSHGKLKLNGASVTINQQISILDVAGLSFEPDSGWSGETNFAWKGYDGQTYSTTSASINVVVNKKAEAKSSVGGIVGGVAGAVGGVATVGGVLYGLYTWRSNINVRRKNYPFAETLRILLKFDDAKELNKESNDASGIGAAYLKLVCEFSQTLLDKGKFDILLLNFDKDENGYDFAQTLATEIFNRITGKKPKVTIQNLGAILKQEDFIQFALKEYTRVVIGVTATPTDPATTQPTPVIFSSKSGSGTRSSSASLSLSRSASNDEDVESSAGAGIELKQKQSIV